MKLVELVDELLGTFLSFLLTFRKLVVVGKKCPREKKSGRIYFKIG